MPCDARVEAVLQVERFAMQRASGFAVALAGLELGIGDVAALFGPSGSGKTSLLEAMFGLAPGPLAVRGDVRLLGRTFGELPFAERRRVLRHNVAFVMQDAAAALDPLLAVGTQVQRATGRSAADCVRALADLGVADAGRVAARLPHEISGGEAQRALLAVALLRRPELLLADEPSASLDDGAFDLLVERLREVRGQGTAMLLASHDQRLLRALGARTFVAEYGTFRPGIPAARTWRARTPLGGPPQPVLRATGVRVRLGGAPVLDGVDLVLHRGEVVALVGASGAGKTTLARVLAGHLEPDAGAVERPPRRTAVQLLWQDAFASLTPGRTLRSLLAEASAPDVDPVVAASRLSLPPAVLGRTARTLSGGERRRAALLRALVVLPDVLVLDEPTASLDHAAALAVLETLRELRERQGLALLLITHDRDLAHGFADRVAVLDRGRLR